MKELFNKHKIILRIILIVLIIAITVIVFIQFMNKNNGKVTTNKSDKVSANSELDMKVEDQYADLVDKYFNYESISVDVYDNLTTYPLAYKDTIINFNASIVKVFEEKDNQYKIVMDMKDYNDNQCFYYNGGCDYKQHLIVIEGTYKDGVRFLNEEEIKIFGVYKGMETYSIDGTSQVLPRVIVDRTAYVDVDGNFTLYNEKDIRKITEKFFNTDAFTVIKPDYTEVMNRDMDLYSYLLNLPIHSLIKLDNQSNARFDTYRVFWGYGMIDVATEDEDGKIKRNINKSSDGKNFILTSYTEDNSYLELQVYDKDFKRMWTRKFDNVKEYLWDNNNGRIIININNDLYYIDEATGKDIRNPFMVGKGLFIKLLMNGDVIFIANDKSDFITYIDEKGTVKWKNNYRLTPYAISSVTVANNKIYVNYIENEISYNSYVVVYSEDGKKLVDTYERN